MFPISTDPPDSDQDFLEKFIENKTGYERSINLMPQGNLHGV